MDPFSYITLLYHNLYQVEVALRLKNRERRQKGRRIMVNFMVAAIAKVPGSAD